VEGDQIVIEQDGELVRVAHGNVAKARLKPDYGQLFGAGKKRKPGSGKSGGRGKIG
jgi:hypothetical protein